MNRDIEQGCKYPYDGREPVDAAHRTALGVLHDLCDRKGIKSELFSVDDEVKADIVDALATIIREGMKIEAPKNYLL
jgi:hypothetical protein